jgi:hypothetical protein
VGVKNNPRRLAAHFGKTSALLFMLVFLSLIAICVIVGLTGAAALGLAVLAIAWTAAVFALALRAFNRTPMVSVKVTADGHARSTRSTWVVHAAMVPVFALGAVLSGSALLIAPAIVTGLMTVLMWRSRKRVPDVLRKVHALLAPHESVLGDGIGLVRGARSWGDAFRVVLATDRRVLMVAATDEVPALDAAYEHVSRFGLEWKSLGRMGVLSLTVEGETHEITSMGPANLVSIATALRTHGVEADDPAAVSEAERAWQEARHRGESRQPLFDSAAMSTRQFDHGLWLLLAISAFALHLNPLGVTGMVLGIAALSIICGYVSGTTSSLAYLVPLNLLICPTFFFADASGVIRVMLALTVIAATGLWAGSALRRGRGSGQLRRAARGGLRHAVSGVSLVRISALLLALMMGLVATSAAAGFELTDLRLAVDEATAKQLPADGRSNLSGNASSVTYTPGPGLKELVTDEHWDGGPNDGARWELRSSFTKGYNVVSLAHYIFEPRLDNDAAIADFVATKDHQHTEGAGFSVHHTERVIAGRRAYVWTYGEPGRYWYYGAWFPQRVHSVRLECVARNPISRFKGLCREAVGSLAFH